MRIPEYDEPEPDIAIIRGTNDDYKHRTPEPADVALLVEVSETTLRSDRGEKWTAYAKGGIPVYWIVNLVDRQVEVYTEPVQPVTVAQGLPARPAGPGRDRRPAAPPDRRRRHPALTAAGAAPDRVAIHTATGFFPLCSTYVIRRLTERAKL